MNRVATEEPVDFANRRVLVSRPLGIQRHLEAGCKHCTKMVSRWQQAGPLLHIPEILRFARRDFLKSVLLRLKRATLKRQNTLSLLLLLIELAMTLFVAGIVVPSVIRSSVATKVALARGSLHTINIAGVKFLYTYKNIGAAVLGMLIGAAAAFTIAYPAAAPPRNRVFRFWTRADRQVEPSLANTRRDASAGGTYEEARV